MVLLLSEANERSCINYYPSISQNLKREKSEKGKRLNLAKGGTLYSPQSVPNFNKDRNSERMSNAPFFTKRMGADNYRILVATKTIMKTLRLREKKRMNNELYFYRYMSLFILGFCIGYLVCGSI